MRTRILDLLSLGVAVLIAVAACSPAAVTPNPVPASPTPAQLALKAAVAATPDTTALEEAALSAPVAASPPAATAPQETVMVPAATAPEEIAIVPEAAAPPSAVPASLQDEIFLAGAPLFAMMFTCDQLPADAELPAVTWQQAGGTGQLCLYGFAEGEEIQYEIYDSEGVEVETGVTEPTTFDSPQAAAAVILTVESYPPGQWTVIANSPTADMEETFEVIAPEGPPLIAMRLSPGQEAIEGKRELAYLQVGDEVLIYAVHLPPDTEIPVGVYYTAEEGYSGSTMTLHEQAAMPTDETGALSVRLQLDPSYGQGFYCVVIAGAILSIARRPAISGR